MDDRVLGAMMRCGLPCSVIGDAIGNAMSVSVVERLARRLLSQRHCACVSVWLSDFLSLTGSSSKTGFVAAETMPKDRWEMAASVEPAGYWPELQRLSKLKVAGL